MFAALIGVTVYRYLIRESMSSKPVASKLYLPKGSDEAESKRFDTITDRLVLKVLLYDNDGIYVYENLAINNGQKISYNEFRTHLKDLKERDSNLIVIIKPLSTSTYHNTVNILDEMTIGDIDKYAMIDHSILEEKFIDSLLK